MYPIDPESIVLIPAYNEAARIGAVITKARQYLPVLVADDGSKDATASIAETLGAQVIRQNPNQGKGAALRLGMRPCLEAGYKKIITLDADGQHDPDEIPLFLEEYNRNPVGLIIGQRDFSKMPLVRRMANSAGKKLISWAIGSEIGDNQSGYRLIRHDLAEALLDSSEYGFEFEVEMLAICLKNNLGLGWVPIRTIYMDDRKSHISPLHHVINYFRIVRKIQSILRN